MVNRRGVLALEDGTIFRGLSFGAEGQVCAEVVFNTSLSGYQEIITDPSYRGQMITFTCTHIGNVGVNDQDNESPRAQCAAIIAREIETTPSNWRASKSLPEWLHGQNVIALGEIDTRALTRQLRLRSCENESGRNGQAAAPGGVRPAPCYAHRPATAHSATRRTRFGSPIDAPPAAAAAR